MSRKKKPLINSMSGEVIRPGEEYINGPLSLLFVYEEDEPGRWGYYYQSLIDGNYLHAHEVMTISDEGNKRISCEQRVVNAEHVLAHFMSVKDATWIHRNYARWVDLSDDVRNIVKKEKQIGVVPVVIYDTTPLLIGVNIDCGIERSIDVEVDMDIDCSSIKKILGFVHESNRVYFVNEDGSVTWCFFDGSLPTPLFKVCGKLPELDEDDIGAHIISKNHKWTDAHVEFKEPKTGWSDIAEAVLLAYEG